MARRKMAVKDFIEIYEQWQGGQKRRAIARSLGISRSTVQKYIDLAERSSITQFGPKLSRADWVKFIHEKISPHEITKKDGPTTAELIRPYHDLIGKSLKETTGKTIWDRLRRERELDVSYSSFKRYIREHFWEEVMMNRIRILRVE